MDVDPPPEIANAQTVLQEFPLAAGEAIPQAVRPPWLNQPPPKKRPFNWTSGAKSVSWFKRMGMCPKNHAMRYRYKRPDPSGVDALVGLVIHGAIEDAANIRMFPGRRHVKGGIPAMVGKEELLYLLEFQKNALRQNLDVIEAPRSYEFVTAEVLARARDIVCQLKRPINLNNLWVDRKGKGSAEYIWSFPITPGLIVGGVLDLLQVQPNPTSPHAAPLMVMITDWKTGAGQLPTRRELELDPQAQLQLSWARRQFPQAPVVRFRIVNLTTGHVVDCDWSAGREELTLQFCRAAWNVWQRQDETAQVGKHCEYCPYRADCKEYRETLGRALYQPRPGLDTMTVPELIAAHHQATVVYKLADARKKDAGKLLMSALGEKDSYEHGNLKAKKRSRKQDSYMGEGQLLSKLSGLSKQDLASLVTSLCSLNKSKLKDWVMTLPVTQQMAARKALSEHLREGRTAPWIETTMKESVL